MYRLLADIFNDIAMILDCLSPSLPKPLRIAVLSCASVLRALCGVAAGSSKASLSAHFAICGNLAELNAKDSSQETVISLAGMLAGSIVVSYVREPSTTWLVLLLLLAVHLKMNHSAVRAVEMTSLNRQRANRVISELLAGKRALTPSEVARHESVFQRDGVLRWQNGPVMGRCEIGVSLREVLRRAGETSSLTRSPKLHKTSLAHLLEMFQDERYVIWHDEVEKLSLIVLKKGATSLDQLKAWSQALLIASAICGNWSPDYDVATSSATVLLASTLKDVTLRFEDCVREMTRAGWNLKIAALETHSGFRIDG